MSDTRTKSNRDSSIELYRIIVMLLIVIHHYVMNSGLIDPNGPIYAAPLAPQSLYLAILGAWGKTGINCFVLITGYFMCKSDISIRKFMKLLLEIMFYRIVIYLILWITGYEKFTIESLVEFIPIRKVTTSFVSSFLVFYLSIPFLNILVHHMDEKTHRKLLGLCGFVFIFLGTMPKYFGVTMSYASWFCVLFFISSYIRLYPKKIYEKRGVWLGLTILSLTLAILSVVACAWYSQKSGKDRIYLFVIDSNTFLAVFVAVSSFMLFKNIKLRYNAVINTIASSTFGVFCIHTHSAPFKRWLWEEVVDCVGHYHTTFYILGSCILIFCVCAIIDQLRIRFLEKPLFAYLDSHKVFPS